MCVCVCVCVCVCARASLSSVLPYSGAPRGEGGDRLWSKFDDARQSGIARRQTRAVSDPFK